MMIRVKKVKFIVFIFAFLILTSCLTLSLFSQGNQPQSADFSNVIFAVSGTSLRFFDRNAGVVYVYSEASGELRETWTIRELGKNLIRKRRVKR